MDKNINSQMEIISEKTYGKINRIKKNIDKEINKQLEILGQETVNKIKEYIKIWYNSYDPINYNRTESLLNSIVYTVKNRQVRVKFDLRKLNTKKINDGEGWQPHRGFDGVTFTYGLIEWLENGGTGGITTNPRRYDGGIHMLSETEKWLDKYLDKKAKEIIKVVLRTEYKRK